MNFITFFVVFIFFFVSAKTVPLLSGEGPTETSTPPSTTLSATPSATPTITARSCGDPGSPFNGKRIGMLFQSGNTVRFTCNKGYYLQGPATRTCQANQTWTGFQPLCKPISCGEPPKVLHADIFLYGSGDYVYGSLIEFTCKPGFYKEGDQVMNCGDDGKWHGSPPVCKEVRCPQPKPLLNGTIQISNTTEGGVVRYTCNPGYKLFGPHWRKCLKSRRWTGPEPTCFECAGVGSPVFVRKPSHFKHGVVKSKSGNQVTVYYKTEDSEEDVTIIGRGTQHYIIVEDRIPSKEEIFIGSRVLAVNSQRRRFMFATVRSIDGDLYGVQFDWNVGKTEVPLDEIRTLEPPRFCTTCSDPGRPVFSSREDDLTEFIPGMEVIYTCQYTYKMSGSQTRQCQKDGTWTGTTPTCTVHSCDDLEAFPPRHGKRVGNNFTIGNTLEFSCDDGYSLIGQSRLTCTSNGNWSHPTPTCTGVCENFRCRIGEKCKYIQNVGPRCVCRENNECRAVYEPVCGSDGLSYNSPCIMSATACRTGKEIRMVDQGPCLPGGLCQIVPYSVCRGYFPGYFYNSTSKKCQYFIAGGCHPSGWNGFQTEQQCKQSCLADICEQPTNRGPCTLRVPRWTFDSTTGRCKKFNYGGCFGNENNFLTKKLCLRRCKPVEKVSKEGSCPNCVRAKLRKACKESTLAILARVISVLSNHEEKRLQRYHLEIHQVIKDTSGNITLGRTIVSVPYQSSSIKCACLRLPTNKKFVLIGRLSTEQTADRKTGMILSPQSFAHGWSVRIRKQIELKCGNYLPIPIAKQ